MIDQARERILELCRAGHFQEARNFCRNAIESSSKPLEKARAFYWLSQIERLSGNQVAQAEALREANRIDPKNGGVLYCMMQLDFALDKLQSALLHSDFIVKLEAKSAYKPFTSGAKFYKALILYKLGQVDASKQVSEEIELGHVELIGGKLWKIDELKSLIS
jgi:tetratricopeptide (TPR) repeat protein